jgi:hypothetical protein
MPVRQCSRLHFLHSLAFFLVSWFLSVVCCASAARVARYSPCSCCFPSAPANGGNDEEAHNQKSERGVWNRGGGQRACLARARQHCALRQAQAGASALRLTSYLSYLHLQ